MIAPTFHELGLLFLFVLAWEAGSTAIALRGIRELLEEHLPQLSELVAARAEEGQGDFEEHEP